MSLKELIPLLALVVTNLVAVAGIVYYMASALGKRIDDLDKRIGDLSSNMNERFSDVNNRIDDLSSNMNERFSDVNNRIGDLDKRIDDLRQADRRAPTELRCEHRMTSGFSEISECEHKCPGRRPPITNEPRTRQPLPKNRRPHHESRNPPAPASLRTIPPTSGIGIIKSPISLHNRAPPFVARNQPTEYYMYGTHYVGCAICRVRNAHQPFSFSLFPY